MRYRPDSAVTRINSRGGISLPIDGDFEEQYMLLEAEGIAVDQKGRVDLETISGITALRSNVATGWKLCACQAIRFRG
jgi:hypothetical protein